MEPSRLTTTIKRTIRPPGGRPLTYEDDTYLYGRPYEDKAANYLYYCQECGTVWLRDIVISPENIPLFWVASPAKCPNCGGPDEEFIPFLREDLIIFEETNPETLFSLIPRSYLNGHP